MRALKCILNIEGYWREENCQSIPKISGVYFVFENTYDKVNDTIQLKRLLYIGEADNIQERIRTHRKRALWKSVTSCNSEISFAITPVSNIVRSRVESAYICRNKPLLNEKVDYCFDFDKTIIISLGETSFIEALIDSELLQLDEKRHLQIA